MALFDVWMGGHEFIPDKANLKFNVKFKIKFNYKDEQFPIYNPCH